MVLVVAVARGMKRVGAFDLVFQLLAGEAGVLAEVLHAADVLVLGRRFGLLDLGALDDCAGEGVDLGHRIGR